MTMKPEALMSQLQTMARQNGFNVPPPVFLEMEGEFIAVDPEAGTLSVRFPVLEKFENPMRSMQGGMIAAAVDNAIGPLSFMVGPPNVTKSMSLEYLRPIGPDLAYITVHARLEAKDGRRYRYTAEVMAPDGTTLARAESLNVVAR